MGQDASKHKRKGLREKASRQPFSSSPPTSKDTSLDASPDKDPLEPAHLTRSPSVKVPIPRRRSSLTALHLDASHFEKPINGNDVLKHRASTLTSTYKQITKSQETLTPLSRALTQDTLKAPMQPLTTSTRHSSISDKAPSNVSIKPTHIHLPKTFAVALEQMPKPPITKAHRNCYHSHRHPSMLEAKNALHPVPCMTCGNLGEEEDVFQCCMWCSLRICPECFTEFDKQDRKLEVFQPWLSRNKRRTKPLKGLNKLMEKAGNQSLGESKAKPVQKELDLKDAVTSLGQEISKDMGRV